MAVANPEVICDDDNQKEPGSGRGTAPSWTYMQPSKFNCDNDSGTSDLQNLWINNIVTKLRKPEQYDIGGYCQETLDLWFFFKTTLFPGNIYLLNIFVCNIKPSFVSLDIASKNTILVTEKGCILSDEFVKSVVILKNEGNHYLKTYKFSEVDLNLMEANRSVLQIPIKVNICSEFSVPDIHPLIRNKIKLDHDLSSLLTKNNFDYALESMNGNKYGVHKIVLIAHSPVLKELVNKTKETYLSLDLDDAYVEVIIEFLYTGKFPQKQQGELCFIQLLDIAEKFKIDTLSAYTNTLKSNSDMHKNLAKTSKRTRKSR